MTSGMIILIDMLLICMNIVMAAINMQYAVYTDRQGNTHYRIWNIIAVISSLIAIVVIGNYIGKFN